MLKALAVEQKNASKRKDPPRLLTAQHKDGSVQGVIAADEITVYCVGSETVFDLLLNLQAVYYAWDLSFPTTYQLPAFFQVRVLQDNRETTFKGASSPSWRKR
jgi:hypothetical protein